MKKLPLLILACAAALGMPSLQARAQTSVALNIGPAGYFCGPYNPNQYYCYGLPVVTSTDGVQEFGSLWTDNYAAYFGNQGFVNFFGVSVPNAVIESVTPITGGIEEELSGPGYTGMLTLYFTTYKSTSGGGRGGGGAGTKWTVLPSSSLVINWDTITPAVTKPTLNSPIAPGPPLCPSDMDGCPKGK